MKIHCVFTSCDNDAWWLPVVVFVPSKTSRSVTSVRMCIDVALCNEHRKKAEAEGSKVLSPKVIEEFKHTLARKGFEIDERGVLVEYVGVDSAEAQRFLAAKANLEQPPLEPPPRKG